MVLDKENCIKATSLFRRLNDKDISLIAQMAEERHFKKGERIFEEGDKEGALYLVISGGVTLAKKFDQKSMVTLTVATTGDFFGEISFFDQKPQVVTAITNDDCQLLSLDYASLRGLMVLYPRIAHEIYIAVLELQSQLLRESNARLKEFLKKACE
jgi:CRP-like cAMP-binding protein